MPFAESVLFLHPQPVRIALGEDFDMDRYDRRRWRMEHHRLHGHGGLVGGVILAGIGVLLLLQNLNIPGFEDLERYWPVILIVVGIAQASRSLGMGGKVWGGAISMVGVVFLLQNFGIIQHDVWRFLWPGILILVGLAMLARAIDRQSYSGTGAAAATADAKKMGEDIRNRIVSDWSRSQSTVSVDHLAEWAVFSGVRRRVDTQDFQGGEVFAMFGGVEIDMRKAAIKRDEVVVEINALFGGVEVRAPENCTVIVRGVGIFGGYEDKTMDSRVSPDVKQPRLIVNGFAVFGGVTIQN
jgi:predicted membrane protein